MEIEKTKMKVWQLRKDDILGWRILWKGKVYVWVSRDELRLFQLESPSRYSNRDI